MNLEIIYKWNILNLKNFNKILSEQNINTNLYFNGLCK